MAKLTYRAYNAIYKARKTAADLAINTRQRTIFYNISTPESLEIRQAKVLMSEFNFAAQSELR